MPKINIENMTLEDIQSISPILSSEFDDFWNTNQLISELNNPNTYCYIAKVKNEIVAFIAIWQVIDEVHLNDIVVKKNFRNLGIGTLLLEHVINICKNIERYYLYYLRSKRRKLNRH